MVHTSLSPASPQSPTAGHLSSWGTVLVSVMVVVFCRWCEAAQEVMLCASSGVKEASFAAGERSSSSEGGEGEGFGVEGG